MADSAAEKTQEPTPKRLREAREKGQVPRSRELGNLAGVAITVLTIAILGGELADMSRSFLRDGLSLRREDVMNMARMGEHFSSEMWLGLLWLLPILLLGFVAAFIGPVLFGGWNFSTKALTPDPARLNPFSGIKRIFSLTALVELGKAILKFLLLGGLSVIVLWGWHERVLGLGNLDLDTGMANGLAMCLATLAALCGGLAVIAGVDIPFQYFHHRKQLRMTLQEVKDEMKETEGKPEVKQQIRQLQQQMARKRMAQQIPRASVVINNPEHFSVALRYDPDGSAAPLVVAKGADHLAEVIRELAREHQVPQLRLPPLARALYRHVAVDQEIPAGLYLAVAQVLSYLFALNSAQQQPEMPDPEIPTEFRWNPEDA